MSKSMTPNQDTFILIVPLAVGGLLYYFTTLLEKEKCQCSDMWQRDYIKYYSLVMILLVLLQVLFDNYSLKKALGSIWGLATIINIYAVYTYGKYLRETDCHCAVKDHRDLYNFMVYYNYFQITMVLLTLVLVAMMVFLHLKNKK